MYLTGGFDGRAGDLPITLRSMAVAAGKQGALHRHRVEDRRADAEVAVVHVTTVDVRRTWLHNARLVSHSSTPLNKLAVVWKRVFVWWVGRMHAQLLS